MHEISYNTNWTVQDYITFENNTRKHFWKNNTTDANNLPIFK